MVSAEGRGRGREGDGDGDKQHQRPAGRPEPVLAWMKRNALISVDDETAYSVDTVGRMDPRLGRYLVSNNFPTLFSIQKAVWELSHGGLLPHHDICFSAPTGSGKTLAYALPIVNALASRADRRTIGCIVVLPTRGLAVQVARVFEGLCSAVGLKTVVACGGGGSGLDSDAESEALRGADVGIFTPGRLVSHIESTHGFYDGRIVTAASKQPVDRFRGSTPPSSPSSPSAPSAPTSSPGVPFLVVDEADRLLRQTYSNWIEKLGVQNVRVKFVVSATLTRDPLKLDVLALNAPRFVTFVQEDNKYKLPKTLAERKIVVNDSDKPSALLGLLQKHRVGTVVKKTIVFVSSVEAAGTLARLLTTSAVRDALGLRAEEYSGKMDKRRREETIENFRRGETRVLVCSDAITRGIDIPNVELVINYDAPVYAKTYVHRAGRTARGRGQTGLVVTMLRKEDVRHFKDMLRKVENNYIEDVALGEAWGDGLKEWRALVDEGLTEMSRVGEVEGGGEEGGAKEEDGDKRARRERDRERKKKKKTEGKGVKRRAFASLPALPALASQLDSLHDV